MFNIKLDESRILSNTVAIISDFITEATFSITKEGVKLTAMDPANISMVILDILPSAFTSYQVDGSEEITINLDNLKQALRRVKPTEPISLTAEGNRLVLTIFSKSIKKFQIPMLEKETKEKQAPSLEFAAKIEIDAKEFRDLIDDASVVGDALNFVADSEKLQLSAGDTGSKVNIDLAKGSDALVSMDVKEKVTGIYSTEYLKKMAKSSVLSDTAIIQFSSDYPLKIDFKSLNKLQMSFILAPRIENK
ncbi:proliferating cell nuclear antigen (pcna) [Candidatus Woesearchaeota archaeon]|jgi:proliferating cell nuclear antigen|nr:proliferating cell nuclear antigen (pcna) [Candidatus Woesearchaeota archaeon]MBT7063043.1 proliferating cell nuclear antigen (pcna) [Candidatus Woesearchaeota archaeon]MBT7402482.1 proliferating cell nuclear antigen (pcna) [Candidatus Woesearchaeota archaeon]